jgi:glycerophosphoryl diester phosphodiesterase
MNWTQFYQERQTRRYPLVVAHRGTPLVQPENTLPAFSLALQQGADALETDLRFTQDVEIVLFHDATLERMTNGHGAVSSHKVSELKRLQTRAPDGSWSAAQVPTLAELIECTHSQTPLLLELKDARFADVIYARKLVNLLDRYDMIERCAIVSFQSAYVAAVEQVCPQIPTGNITLKNPLPTGKAELLGPVWPLIYLNPFYVAWAHRLNKVVAPLDPRPEPRLTYYLRRRVDALLADDPAAVVAGLKKLDGFAGVSTAKK